MSRMKSSVMRPPGFLSTKVDGVVLAMTLDVSVGVSVGCGSMIDLLIQQLLLVLVPAVIMDVDD